MKKIFLSAAVLLAGFAAANAQATEGFKFGAGVKVALPVGDFSKASSLGIGAEGQAEYGFSEKLSAVGSVGYTHFLEKNNSGFDGGYVPVLAGVRYYAAPSIFLGAKAGVAIATAKGGGSSFNYLPHVGYNTEKFQVTLGYDAFTKNSNTSGAIAATGIIKF